LKPGATVAKIIRLPQYEIALRALDALPAERARYSSRQWLEMLDELQFRLDEMYKVASKDA
jgi:hypothetical protein